MPAKGLWFADRNSLRRGRRHELAQDMSRYCELRIGRMDAGVRLKIKDFTDRDNGAAGGWPQSARFRGTALVLHKSNPTTGGQEKGQVHRLKRCVKQYERNEPGPICQASGQVVPRNLTEMGICSFRSAGDRCTRYGLWSVRRIRLDAYCLLQRRDTSPRLI